MKISVHFITSAILTAILWPFIGLYSLWIMVGGFLIDFDHYLYAGFKWKMWDLKESYKFQVNWSKNPRKKNGEILHIFHTIEFWIFMITMSFISYRYDQIFLFYMFAITFSGMILHLILDGSHALYRNRLGERALSLLWWLKTYGHKKAF